MRSLRHVLPLCLAASLTTTATTACHDKPTEATRVVTRAPLFAVASDTVLALQARDSLHRLIQRADLDTLASWRTGQQPQWFRAALARLRAHEDSLAMMVTVVEEPPPPPPPPPPGCSLVGDWSAVPMSPFPQPGYLSPATEPDYHTLITRISGDPGTTIAGTSGQWPQIAGSMYAKRQGWSADGAFLVVYLDQPAPFGGGVALLVDGATYQPIRPVSPAPSYVWHPTLADVMIGVQSSGSVVGYNARTDIATPKATVTGYSGGWLGKGEGNVSNDGRYVPVYAVRASDGKRVAFVVDDVAGTKGPDLDLAAEGFASATDLDWVSVSQSGRYVVLFGTVGGVWGRSKVYDRATMALVHDWTDYTTGHADVGLDAAGNDVLFGGANGAPYVKQFIARRLDTGAVTVLSPAISYDWHASTRNTARPGWGYVVTNNATGTVVDQTVYALALDGSQRIERLARHRSNLTDYEAYPFAVPSPDGTRVLLRSNWGAGSGRPVGAYVIDARGCQ